jgi:hypothetical protein
MSEPETEKKTPPSRILCAVLAVIPPLGALGIHKFVMGQPTVAIIPLCVSLVCCPLGCFLGWFTFGFGFVFNLGPLAMAIIGVVEGIIYFTKTDEEWHKIYIVEKKAWF